MRDYEKLKNRKVVLYVPACVVLDMLLNWRRKKTIILPCFTNIPADVEYQYVHYDDKRDSFLFVLLHEEFDVVPDGAMIPEIKAELEKVKVINNMDEV